MSFSDIPFAYGPFVPHHVPKQYVEGYFSAHRLDRREQLNLNTTVENLSLVKRESGGGGSWKLTLRKYDAVGRVDVWWEEVFDAVVLANGHYSVPYVFSLSHLTILSANITRSHKSPACKNTCNYSQTK